MPYGTTEWEVVWHGNHTLFPPPASFLGSGGAALFSHFLGAHPCMEGRDLGFVYPTLCQTGHVRAATEASRNFRAVIAYG